MLINSNEIKKKVGLLGATCSATILCDTASNLKCSGAAGTCGTLLFKLFVSFFICLLWKIIKLAQTAMQHVLQALTAMRLVIFNAYQEYVNAVFHTRGTHLHRHVYKTSGKTSP